MKSWSLQEAVSARLNDASVTGLLSSQYAPEIAIFSDVPQAADSGDESYFPFVTIGADAISPYDTKDAVGGSALVQIDVWARQTSMEGLKTIADAIDARMRRQALTITGATHIDTFLESATALRDPDGRTKRMLMLYRVLYLTD